MTTTKIKYKLLTSVALAAALVGCGGGSSDASSVGGSTSALNGVVVAVRGNLDFGAKTRALS